jgi:hypothetical protein
LGRFISLIPRMVSSICVKSLFRRLAFTYMQIETFVRLFSRIYTRARINNFYCVNSLNLPELAVYLD